MEKKYKQWRDLILDPFEIKFKKIKLNKIINYFPAGNDVLECECYIDNISSIVVLKIERSKMADFDTEEKNLKLLYKNNYINFIPKVYESGKVQNRKYLILEKIEGNRLSDIVEQKLSKFELQVYLKKYGKMLAKVHKIPIDGFNMAKQRIINDVPKIEDYPQIDKFIQPYITYLKDNKPVIEMNTFIHGDFHYANVLWKNKEIIGLLDFEYSGKGFKEQDIAWACVLRPNQQFMNNVGDIKAFLTGYLEDGKFDYEKLKWCLINAYCHFYLMNIDDTNYIKQIDLLLNSIKNDKIRIN